MKATIGNKLLALVGRLYLQLRLRETKKIEQELRVKYENHYHNAGLSLLFDMFMALMAVAAAGLLAAVLYAVTA